MPDSSEDSKSNHRQVSELIGRSHCFLIAGCAHPVRETLITQPWQFPNVSISLHRAPCSIHQTYLETHDFPSLSRFIGTRRTLPSGVSRLSGVHIKLVRTNCPKYFIDFALTPNRKEWREWKFSLSIDARCVAIVERIIENNSYASIFKSKVKRI